MKYLKLFYLLPLAFCLILACSESPTDNGNTITVSGTVALDGRSDHSGVKVSLYKPVELDTVLVRINQQYPNIGVQISQETEFDHREHNAAYSTTSNAAGTWQIGGVAPGEYNVVAEKDSFGWRYVYELNASNSSNKVNTDTFYQSRFVSGVITESITLKSGQFLIVSNDVVFSNTSEIIFSDKNTILISPNKKITINGTIITSSLESLLITSEDVVNLGRGVTIDSDGQVNLQNLVVSHLSSGITLDNNPNMSVEISGSIIKNCTNNGIYANNNYVNLNRSLFNDINGYALEVSHNFNIQDNIFINSKGILLLDNSGNVENNLFESNHIGIIPYKGDISIKNNDFDKNSIAIAVNSSECQIKLNNFFNNGLDIETNRNYVQYPIFIYSNPIIENNNINSERVISVWGQNSIYGGLELGVGINNDLEAKNCYWNDVISFNIDIRILDRNDNDKYLYYVFYTPYELNRIVNAGVK